MITRKLGKFLRGQATPFQLVAACVLGALLGFAPGYQQGPALYLILVTLLLVVNANLGLALLVAGGAKLLAIFGASYSFQVGQWLLDGPAGGAARVVVNAPVLAWAGLESYAATGGLLIGLGLGVLAGLLAALVVGSFRRRMLAAQHNVGRMQVLMAKRSSRLLVWLFFGSKGKKTWEDKLAQSVGNPIRVWGVVLLAVVFGGLWYAQATLAGPLAKQGLQAGLEKVNGATVDVGDLEVDLAGGKLSVGRIALADREALDSDLFRAARLEADLDTTDLLRRRFHMTRVVVSNVESGVPRAWPGELYGPPDQPTPEPDVAEESDYSLDQVLADYKVWKERLTQARRWIDRFAGSEAHEEAPEEVAEHEAEAAEDAAAAAERLRREAEANGWYSVIAERLIEESPRFLLSELVVDGLSTSYLPDRTFDVKGYALSTQPALVDEPPRLEIASRDGQVSLALDLAPVSRKGGDGALRFAWHGLSVDDTLAKLRLPGPAPFQGGTLDLEIDGAWDQGRIGYVNLPLTATLHDTVLHVEGLEPTHLTQLVLPIGLHGPLDAPRIRFDASAISDALVAAGKQELAARVDALKGQAQAEVEARTEEAKDKLQQEAESRLGEELEEKLPDAKNTLKNLFGRKKGDGPQ